MKDVAVIIAVGALLVCGWVSAPASKSNPLDIFNEVKASED